MLATQKSFVTRALTRLGSENAFQILQRAREIEATGRRVVHMEIGEPDFDTPDNIKRAAVDSLLAHDTHYTPSQGTLELREVVADYASRFRKVATPYTAANVTISPGAKPIIWNILCALLDPGDEMVYFEPAYPTYASASSYLHARCTIPLHEERDWRMDLDELAARVSGKRKC